MKLRISYFRIKKLSAILLFSGLFCFPAFSAEPQRVSIYDDFDDGGFGRSEYRSVIRTVKLPAFSRSSTLSTDDPSREGRGLLTAVVLSAGTEAKLRQGVYPDVRRTEEGVYRYSREGLEFTFSLEKPGPEILLLLKDYYQGPYAAWLESVTLHYEENFIIRIHSAENIFDPWTERIDYNEALLMATVLGDRDQWLWGIHDGLDLLNPGE